MKILLTGPPNIGKTTLLAKFVHDFEGTKRGILCREIRDENRNCRIGFKSIFANGFECQFMTKTKLLETKEDDDNVTDNLPRVGSYTVNVPIIDQYHAEELRQCLKNLDDLSLVYIDELGHSQSYSNTYLDLARQLFLKVDEAPPMHNITLQNNLGDQTSDDNRKELGNESFIQGKGQDDQNSGTQVINTKTILIATIVYMETKWNGFFKNMKDVWLFEVTKENRDNLLSIMKSMVANENYLYALSEHERDQIKYLLYYFLQKNHFTSAKKLFTNALIYYKTLIIVPDESIKQRDATDPEEGLIFYEVKGKTNSHTVKRKTTIVRIDKGVFGKFIDSSNSSNGNFTNENVDNTFSCDCPLFLQEGQYSCLQERQMCSHEMCVRLSCNLMPGQ